MNYRCCLLFSVLAVCTLSACAQVSSTTNSTPVKPAEPHPGLMNPKLATAKAPEKFDVEVTTTKGNFTITVDRTWSPNGADRFYNLVSIGYFNDIGIFRAIKGFMFQFGIHGDPNVNKKWSDANIKDDPAKGISNTPGTITFARTGAPDSRSTQFFINLGNNDFLDNQGFTPFGKVTKGADVITKINTEYGENPRSFQGQFEAKGNAYLKERMPKVDYIKSVRLAKPQKQK